MKLKKFPVTSKEGNQYEVHIRDCSASTFIWWNVNVYVRRNSGLLKLKRVHTWQSGWINYEKYIGKYKEMAIESVEEYERFLEEHRQEKLNIKNGLEEFEKWNGEV